MTPSGLDRVKTSQHETISYGMRWVLHRFNFIPRNVLPYRFYWYSACTLCNFIRKMKLLPSFLKEEIDLITSKMSKFIFRMLTFHGIFGAVPRQVFIPMNRHGRLKTEPKFLKTSQFFFNFNQFNNCPFFLPNYFVNLFSCLASKSS